ncbi:high-potential iron-sulfur protein [Cupriavidus basilensis]|uniref:high-potential iron-sulfur protein n=1 Tax=Cupriavidus TaxID=106589 RepID=UPI0009DE624F|nr:MULTISPECIES: high-potential iron-sulfur protein [Cupriavidus]MDF3887797.1 high-potential iron-sulfur protein [Cupriavidus basilensis]
MSNRRQFLKSIPVVAAATTLAVSTLARAQAGGSILDDKDPPAVDLGYKADTNKVDKTKYPKHEASQRCGNCYLYDGKAGAPKGDCPLFGGQVAANGWCIAWVKKA